MLYFANECNSIVLECGQKSQNHDYRKSNAQKKLNLPERSDTHMLPFVTKLRSGAALEKGLAECHFRDPFLCIEGFLKLHFCGLIGFLGPISSPNAGSPPGNLPVSRWVTPPLAKLDLCSGKFHAPE